MNVEQLDANEKQAFLSWRRKLVRFVLFSPHLKGSLSSSSSSFLLLLVEFGINHMQSVQMLCYNVCVLRKRMVKRMRKL